MRTNRHQQTEQARRAALNSLPRPGTLVASPAAHLAAKLDPTIRRYAPRPVTKPASTVTDIVTSSTPTAAEIAAARRARWRDTYKRVHTILLERYPEIFSCARPLAIGIHRELFEALSGALSRKQITLCLAGWTKRPAYQAALAAGVRRVRLDGSDAGPAFDHSLPEARDEPRMTGSWQQCDAINEGVEK